MFGFCVLVCRNTGLLITFLKRKKRLDFRDVLWKILFLLARKHCVLGYGLNFMTFFWQRVVKPKVKHTAFLCGFRLFPQAKLLIGWRFALALFLTDLYLECSYEDLLCIHARKEKCQISSTLFLSCKQETKYNILDIMLWKNIEYVMLILFFVHDTF